MFCSFKTSDEKYSYISDLEFNVNLCRSMEKKSYTSSKVFCLHPYHLSNVISDETSIWAEMLSEILQC